MVLWQDKNNKTKSIMQRLHCITIADFCYQHFRGVNSGFDQRWPFLVVRWRVKGQADVPYLHIFWSRTVNSKVFGTGLCKICIVEYGMVIFFFNRSGVGFFFCVVVDWYLFVNDLSSSLVISLGMSVPSSFIFRFPVFQF